MIDAPCIGTLQTGALGSIADVAGVAVGHATLADGAIQTGVTVIRPHAADPYRHPLAAAAVVINGFGKTTGLVQLNELGTLESPIALTNTFAVGTIFTAMMRRAARDNPAMGRTSPTMNPVVAECNDGFLNDLQAFAVGEHHYDAAFDDATSDFAQGAVGAGRGMSCFGLKGGIGSASRIAHAAGQRMTTGALVLANFGRLPRLTLRGMPIGRALAGASESSALPDRGSIIVVLATDAPLDHRQLRRLAMRSAAGIARTGSNFGHGSGDIAIAFAGSKPPARSHRDARAAHASVPDDILDPLFDAAAEATEQSIVNALFAAETLAGHAGHLRQGITERMPDWRERIERNTPRSESR
jgi:D-aminopeptidase